MPQQVKIMIDSDGRTVAERGPEGPIEVLKTVPRIKPRVRFIQPKSRIVRLMEMG